MSARSEPHILVLTLRRSKFLVLLLCLLGLFLVQPMLPRSPNGEAAIHLDIAFSLVLLAGVWSVNHRIPVLIACLGLAALGLGAAWFAHGGQNPSLAMVALISTLVLLVITVISVLRHVLDAVDVTTDTILGGVCAYMLLALVWVLIYGILERLEPGSFNSSNPPLIAPRDVGALIVPDFVYYSVFVLTTVGPQEIHPISGPARAWTGVQAMVGQFYVAVLIARLVGLHTSQRSGNSES